MCKLVLKKVIFAIRYQANIKTYILLKNSKLQLNFGIILFLAAESVDKKDNIRFVTLYFASLVFLKSNK